MTKMTKWTLRLGFIRLWVVIATGWIVGSSLFLYYNANLPKQPERGAIASAIALERDHGIEAPGYSKSLKMAHIRELIAFDFTEDGNSSLTLDSGRKVIFSRNETPNDVEERVFNTVLSRERLERIAHFIGFILLPPIALIVILFAFGKILIWVSRGFVADTDSNA